MTLVWKLLRRHISVPQFAGFVFANFFGMLIVLLGYQFYRDVLPVFTSQDSFMKSDYVIISKKVGAAGALSGRANTFSQADIDGLVQSGVAGRVGSFASAGYRVDARMGVNGQPVLSSEIFFESVPDGFVDAPESEWKYQAGSREIPIILPRTYINMYNFGFAQNRSLPKISEGLVGMIDFNIHISGNGLHDEYKGRVIGFSGRLNTILVPQSFIDWSNARYAPRFQSAPTRLIVEMANPGGTNVAKYLDDNGLEADDDRLRNEKTAYILRTAVTTVMAVGGVISLLSLYILMLSIYLLVQKNSSKLENLLLIGYSPMRTAAPYALLTLGLNALVLIAALAAVASARGYYMSVIETLFPRAETGSMLPSVMLGLALFAIVSAVNVAVIYRKIMRIWWRKDG